MTTITLPDAWVDPHGVCTDDDITLIGVDGNAFAVMAHVSRVLRRSGNPPSVIEAYRNEATSGDYGHLLATSMVYLGFDPYGAPQE